MFIKIVVYFQKAFQSLHFHHQQFNQSLHNYLQSHWWFPPLSLRLVSLSHPSSFEWIGICLNFTESVFHKNFQDFSFYQKFRKNLEEVQERWLFNSVNSHSFALFCSDSLLTSQLPFKDFLTDFSPQNSNIQFLSWDSVSRCLSF